MNKTERVAYRLNNHINGLEKRLSELEKEMNRPPLGDMPLWIAKEIVRGELGENNPYLNEAERIIEKHEPAHHKESKPVEQDNPEEKVNGLSISNLAFAIKAWRKENLPVSTVEWFQKMINEFGLIQKDQMTDVEEAQIAKRVLLRYMDDDVQAIYHTISEFDGYLDDVIEGEA